MRIIYGVMGYGRGHATRTATVLPDLMRQHDVMILAGGDAYAQLEPMFPDAIQRIPTLGYRYTTRGKRSAFLTAKENLPAVLDLIWRGPTLAMVMQMIRDFGADVIISDAEAYTQRAGKRLDIPRITFDHFGILTHCKPALAPGDRWKCERDRLAYLMLMGQPTHVIVSSFYDAPPRRPGVRVVGPLLRDEVLRVSPRDEEYLLAYFNNGAFQFTPWVETALKHCGRPVRVYGTQRIGTQDNLDFRPPGNEAFIDDLAGCAAVISTAGNQLVGEALHFGKAMLVMPEECVEQRCNALAVKRLGIGMQVAHRQLSAMVIRDFLSRLDEFEENIRHNTRDGRREALEAIDANLHELAGRPSKPTYIRKVS